MSLTPTALVDRLETAAGKLSATDPALALACEEAAAFFREELDIEPSAHADEECTGSHA